MSAIVQAGGQFLSDQEQASAYGASARNAQQEARVALEQSNYRAGEIQDETTRAAGAQRAAYGAAGVSANAGTPLMVMANTAAKGARAQLAAQYQGRVNATASQQQSDADLAAKSAALQQSWLQPVGTLLTAGEGAAATMMTGGGG